MTNEQRQYKGLIKADLKPVNSHYDDNDKAMRLQAAYHMQQAIEKTIKLKAEVEGLNLWGHDIDILIKKCTDNNMDIDIPDYIREKADIITQWEAECRYYPVKIVRKDTLKKAYDITVAWLEQGNTK